MSESLRSRGSRGKPRLRWGPPLAVGLALLLSSCETKVSGTAGGEGFCPAPEIVAYDQDAHDRLADEIEIGVPMDTDEQDILAEKLQRALDKGSLWDQFPAIFSAVAEYVTLRAAIEECN